MAQTQKKKYSKLETMVALEVSQRKQRFQGAERVLFGIAILYSTMGMLHWMRSSAVDTKLQLQQQQLSITPIITYRRSWNGERPTTFLIGIFTVMEAVHRRRLIRESMLGKEIPSHVRSKICSLQAYQEKGKNLSCRVIYTFVVGGNPQAPEEWKESNTSEMTMDASKMLKHENDILYLNIHENMNGGKSPTWFDYASRHTDIDYIAKADSDSLISIPSLLSYMERDLPPGNQKPKIYGGHLNEYDECGGSIGLCDKVRGKVYMSGQFYWLSAELARYVSTPATRAREFLQTNNEDFDIGIKVLSYPEPIQLMACNGAQFWIHPLKTDEEWSATFHSRIVDKWMLADNVWRNGLYEAKQDKYQSVLGKVMEVIKPPTMLD